MGKEGMVLKGRVIKDLFGIKPVSAQADSIVRRANVCRKAKIIKVFFKKNTICRQQMEQLV